MSDLHLKIAIQVVSLIGVLALQFKFAHRVSKEERTTAWKTNFAIGILNSAIMVFFFNKYLFQVTEFTYNHDVGLLNLIGYSQMVNIVLSIFILDYFAYIWHIANHKYAFLWRFHKSHHSDELMEASTAYRFHIGEVIISFGIRIFAVYFFGLPLEGYFAFEVVYNLNNLLVHSDIKYPAKLELLLSKLFVTPKLHELHHSVLPKEANSNYGTIFSIWDRMQSTLHPFSSDQKVKLGLDGLKDSRSIKDVLLMPLKKNRHTTPDNLGDKVSPIDFI